MESTTLTSIALSVLVATLFSIPFGPFLFFLLTGQETVGMYNFLEFFDDQYGSDSIYRMHLPSCIGIFLPVRNRLIQQENLRFPEKSCLIKQTQFYWGFHGLGEKK